MGWAILGVLVDISMRLVDIMTFLDVETQRFRLGLGRQERVDDTMLRALGDAGLKGAGR